jgi:hypothetical protein
VKMRGGRAGFIGGVHAGRAITPSKPAVDTSSILVRIPFLTRFSRTVLEFFWDSKWVIQHITGKLSTSSFQRYKVCVNWSSDERVMAPESRGVGAIFVRFSSEDSGQTGDAIGEPRVPCRSWSRYLSNAPGLADQLVASRKDSAREGGGPGGKTRFTPSAFFSQILSQFARIFDLAPDVGFRRSWYRWKACVVYFCKVPDLRKSELGLARYGPANGGHWSVFGPFEDGFPIGIPASPSKFLAIREFLVVHECILFPTHLGL